MQSKPFERTPIDHEIYDAAMHDLYLRRSCQTCIHYDKDDPDKAPCRGCCPGIKNWAWRGLTNRG